MAKPVAVKPSPYLSKQLEDLRIRAASSAFHRRLLEEVENACVNLRAPEQCFADYRNRLGKRRYDLTGVRKYKGALGMIWDYGLRIFYLACESTNRAVILEFGERIPGSTKDAHEQFGDRLVRGYYDPIFVLLGQRHAYWKVPDAPQALASGKRA